MNVKRHKNACSALNNGEFLLLQEYHIFLLCLLFLQFTILISNMETIVNRIDEFWFLLSEFAKLESTLDQVN